MRNGWICGCVRPSRSGSGWAISALEVEVVSAGEELHVEISAKFRPERIIDELHELGFDTQAHWTDDRDDFGLLLATRH